MKMKFTLFLLLIIMVMPINAQKNEHYRGPYPIDFSQNCEVLFFIHQQNMIIIQMMM